MATEERMLLTPQGKIDLERERDLLRDVKRPQLMQRIQELSSDGDVSDNSEYEDVKEELIQLESRIREIENFLGDAEVVERVDSNGVVSFGSTVTLVDDENEEEARRKPIHSRVGYPMSRQSVRPFWGNALVTRFR
jgi:transcription elongation factor GreA